MAAETRTDRAIAEVELCEGGQSGRRAVSWRGLLSRVIAGVPSAGNPPKRPLPERAGALLNLTPNPPLNRSAGRRCRWVPVALRARRRPVNGITFGPWRCKSICGVRVARGGRAKLIAFGFVTRSACNGARPGRLPSWHCPSPIRANPAHVHDCRSVGGSGSRSGAVAFVHGLQAACSHGWQRRCSIKQVARARLPRAAACQRTVVRFRRW